MYKKYRETCKRSQCPFRICRVQMNIQDVGRGLPCRHVEMYRETCKRSQCPFHMCMSFLSMYFSLRIYKSRFSYVLVCVHTTAKQSPLYTRIGLFSNIQVSFCVEVTFLICPGMCAHYDTTVSTFTHVWGGYSR